MASTSDNNVKRKVNLSKLSSKLEKPSKKVKMDVENNNKSIFINKELEDNSKSIFFPQDIDIPTKLIALTKSLNESLGSLEFPNICYIYNPTEYALDPYIKYIKKYCGNEKEILFIGMNPGPFGMCQSGVPFGDVNMVQGWLNIVGEVFKPTVECPDRPVLGFECQRREESGKRFWNYFKNISSTAEIFFKHCFIYNYIPLAFLDDTGKNVTPASMTGASKKSLQIICDNMLLEVIRLLKPKIIINIGSYAQARTKAVIKNNRLENLRNICMRHPSPLAGTHEKWIKATDEFLQTENLLHYFENKQTQEENETIAEQS